jgi:hypothetical protein
VDYESRVLLGPIAAHLDVHTGTGADAAVRARRILGISFLEDLLFAFPFELPESSPASLLSSTVSSVERMEATSVHQSESEKLRVDCSGSSSASRIGEM